MTYWWLSFADGNLPAGTQFLGCAIVPASDFISAVMAVRRGGYNPGGEVMGREFVVDDDGGRIQPPPEYVGRLLTKAEAETLDAKMCELYPNDRRDAEAGSN